MPKIKSVSDLKTALRNGPYAWPGRYPLYFVTADGEAMSFKTVQKEFKIIASAIKNKSDDGWRVIAVDVNWEDENLTCAHTDERIESAYGNESAA